MKSIFSVIIVCLALNISAQNEKNIYTKAKVHTADTGLVQMQKLGIAVDDGFIKKNEYIIRDFNTYELKLLKDNGFLYEVIIEDVQKHYIERNQKPKKKDAGVEKSKRSSCNPSAITTPQYFSLGSMGGFYTLSEIEAELDSMRQRFPDFVSGKTPVSSIQSIESRNIYYVRLSNNPDIVQNKPRVMYMALTHAREPAGMQQLFFFMYYLLENYSTHATASYILNNCELYFVLCANPDGYLKNETDNPNGGGMHRKNTRPNGTSNPGVDLNRNYGFQWGYDNAGSSPDPQTDTYRGTAGFSEPETQAIKEFSELMNFDLAMDIHCYSNLLIYPWGFVADSLTEDSTLYKVYASIMTEYNGYKYGTPSQTVNYVGNGGTVDWFYGEQTTKSKTIGLSPEAGDMNDGFWPEVDRIEEICGVNLEANMYLALFSTKYARVSDTGSRFLDGSGSFGFTIQSLGMEQSSIYTVSLIPTGNTFQSTGNSVNFTGMQLLETRTGAIDFELTADVMPGQEVAFLYKIETDAGEYYSDTIRKIYGSPELVFHEVGTDVNNWVTTHWGITSEDACQGSSSITDSPYDTYPSSTTRYITLKDPIDLTDAIYAELKFCAKWDILAGYDYVELSASDNGSAWQVLCGKYSKELSQNSFKPSYDGNRADWVHEEVSLNNFLGKEIKIRFKLYASYYFWVDNDGFYFDDMEVLVLRNTQSTTDIEKFAKIKVWPNPVYDMLNIQCVDSQINEYRIISIDGRLIAYGKPDKHSVAISVDEITSGLYYLQVVTEKGLFTQKFIRL